MTRRSAVALFTLMVACRGPVAADRLPAPRAAVVTPSDLLPVDLDFVVRVDTERLRKEPAFEEAIRSVTRGGESGMFRSVLARLEHSRALWVGGRVMSDGFHGDGVMAIEPARTADREIAPLDSSFRPSNERIDNARIFERSTDARDQAVVAIAIDGGGIVLATTAEADAVLRVLRAGPDEGRLDPPARGLVAFASRAPAIALLMPNLLAEGFTHGVGSIEGGDAIHLETELAFASPDQAARALSALELAEARLAGAREPWRFMADSMKLAREGNIVRLRVAVPFAIARELH